MEKFVEVRDELGSRIEKTGLAQILGRVRLTVRRSWSAGYGWAVVSVLLFSIAVGLGFQAWFRARKNAQQVRETSQRIIDTHQEAGRSEEHVGLLAMVLADINSGEALPEFDELDELTGFLRETADYIAGGPALGPPDAPDRCPAKAVDATFGLEPGLCWQPLFGSVFVPPTELFSADGGDSTRCPASWTRVVDSEGERWCLAPRVSDSKDVALRLAQTTQRYDAGSGSQGQSPRLPDAVPQAYFISADGVLGHVAHQRSSLVVVEDSPLIRWESKPYFKAFLAEESGAWHTTNVYLDMTGHGLVVTRCVLVTHQGQRLGVLCGDVVVPPRFLDPQQLRSVAQDAASLPDTPDTRVKPHSWEDGLLRYSLFTATRRGNELSLDPDLAETLGAGLVTEVTGDGIASLDEPKRVAGGFLLNVGRSSDSIDLLLAEPMGRKNRPEALWGIALASLVLSLLALAFSARTAARMSESAERGALLRNLQLGVLELDREDRIRFANDRAEELLDLRLPRFGTSETHLREVAWSDLIDDRFVIQINEKSQTINPPVHYDEIREDREEGLSGRYFARSKANGRWLLIIGSPITRVSPDLWGRSSPEFATFGMLDEVTQGLTKLLDNVYDSWQRDRLASGADLEGMGELSKRAAYWLKSEEIP